MRFRLVPKSMTLDDLIDCLIAAIMAKYSLVMTPMTQGGWMRYIYYVLGLRTHALMHLLTYLLTQLAGRV